jgi:hypothetical protein
MLRRGMRGWRKPSEYLYRLVYAVRDLISA